METTVSIMKAGEVGVGYFNLILTSSRHILMLTNYNSVHSSLG